MPENQRYNKCYWCGTDATSKEHVPPKNLFPKGSKKDMITVGSCKTHNEMFSKLDERLRFHLTFVSDSPIAQELFTKKSIKGISRPESRKLSHNLVNNFVPDYNGKKLQREDTRILDLYFEKIIRGLHFHHSNSHFKGSTSYFSNKVSHLQMTANAHFYFYCIANENQDEWIEGSAVNKEVFFYQYRFCEEENRFL